MKSLPVRLRKVVHVLLAVAPLAALTVSAQPCIPNPSGLVSWWRGEGNTSDFSDGNSGILVSNATFGLGKAGSAFVLDGDKDGVQVGNATNLQLQDFSIEGWIKRTSASTVSFNTVGSGVVFAMGNIGGYSFFLVSSGHLAFGKIGDPELTSAAQITNTNWHHVALTKLGTNVVFYVDGVAYSAPPYTRGSFTFSAPGYIGAWAGASGQVDNSFYGTIDELAVYNRALTAPEVQAVFQADSGGKCPGPSAPVVIVPPTNQTAFVSENRSFTVVALGPPPFAYQWTFNGTNMSSATNITFTVANVQFSDAGNYAVVITNLYGAVTSSNALLSVNPPPPCTNPPAGLVSWWRGEGNALDQTGRNNGTPTNNAGYGPGRTGQGFVFDGCFDAVMIADSPSLRLQDFTIEAWIQRASPTAASLCWDLESAAALFGYGAGGYAFSLYSDGRLSLTRIGVNKVTTSAILTDTNVHHVAVTKVGSTVVFYVDAVAYPVSAYNPGFTFSTPVAIGARADILQNSFLGSIDELSVYNRALTTNEIRAIYNASVSGKCVVAFAPTVILQPASTNITVGNSATLSVVAGGTAPLSYQWRFNGTNLANATNSALTLNNVQLSDGGNYSVQITNVAGSVLSSNALLTVNPPPPACLPNPSGLVSWWRGEGNLSDAVGTNPGIQEGSLTFGSGKVGQGFVFNGTDADVRIAASPTLNIAAGGSFSVELWLNPTTVATDRPIVEWAVGGTGGVHFWMSQSPPYGTGPGCLFANILDTSAGFHTLVSAAGLVTTNTFHHVALTYDKASGVGVIYLNGAVVAQQNLGSFNPRTSYDLYLGSRPSGSVRWPGRMDEVSVYNRALQISEIQAIYQMGAGGKCPGPAAPVVIVQPTNQTVFAGESPTFAVLALGTSPLAYQWAFNGTNIAGATNSTLALNNVQLANAGTYAVVVTNLYGSATSSNAMLTVNPAPACLPNPSGLVSWWRGEGNLSDAVGTNPGIQEGSLTFGSGKVGQGFVFNGTDADVRIAASPTLNIAAGGSFSVELWLNPTTVATDRPIVEWAVGGTGGVHFWMSQSPPYGTGPGCLFANILDTSAGFHTLVSAAGLVTTNTFHHVALTYDKASGVGVIYLNGAVVAQQNLGSFNPRTSYDLYLGSRPSGSVRWPGRMDEVSVYNRALQISEIQAIYQMGAGGKCPGPAAPVVIVQPTNQTVFAGESPTFAVLALGTSPLAYQWAFNGTNIAGATNSTLALNNVQLANAGTYAVVVTNLYGSATSSNAMLTVNPAPACLPNPSGLVSWWRGEGNLSDAVGTNPGIQEGSLTFGSGKVGQGFVFNGTDADVRIAASPTLNIAAGGSFSVELWLNPTTVATDRPIVEWAVGGTGGVHFWMSQSPPYGTGPGCLFANILDTSAGFHTLVSAAGLVTTNTFHHVALTYDKASGVGVIYLNGAVVAQQNLGSFNPRTSYDLYLGSRPSGSVRWPGRMDEVSVYNRALQISEIQAIYQMGAGGKCPGPAAPVVIVQPTNQTVFAGESPTFAVLALGTSPLAYQWAFNGTNIAGATNSTLALNNVQLANAGTYAVVVTNLYGSATSSNAMLTVNPAPACLPNPSGLVSWWRGEGNGNDALGLNSGALSGGVAFTAGRVAQAFDFNVVNGSVIVPDSASLRLNSTITIEAWIKPRTITGDQAIVGKVGGVGGNNGYQFLLNSGNLRAQFNSPAQGWPGNVIFQPNNAVISTGVWSHVAWTYDQNAMKLFVNGLPVATNVIGAKAITTSSSRLRISGDDNNNTTYFDGLIDEASLYNRALSDAEIQSIYNANASGKCVVAFAPTIILQPANTNVTAGNSATLAVVAGGSDPLSYQWRFNGTNLANATNSALTVKNVQFSDGGNYSVQITNVAGSITSSNALLTVVLPVPVVRLGTTNVIAGTQFSLPVTLAANGNENALGFSLTYNTQRLALVSVELGSGAVGATLLVNSSQVWTGRVGIALASPPQSTFLVGTQEIIRLKFNTLPLLGTSASNSSLVFGDQPILRELLDGQLQTLPASYSNATIIIQPTVFESDVAPRPNGNQTVSLADWLQAARFAARLDAPASSSEFQRADAAPRTTLGDGQLKVTDWVQTGRNLLSLDALLAIGGPNLEIAPVPAAPSATRLVRVLNTNVLQGQPVTMSVVLDAQGDENAVGFTLNFDPAALTVSGVALGADGALATLQPNLLQTASGKLGVALALPIGTTFSPGTKEILQVSLTTSGTSSGPFSITNSDQIVTRCVSDMFAVELPVSFNVGTLTVTSLTNSPLAITPPTSPMLAIVPAGANIVLSWPLEAADFTLQSRSSADGLSGFWSNTPVVLQTNDSTISVTLPVNNDSRFFRLFHQ